MKNFVIEMIGNPIKMKETPQIFETSRASYLEETSNKIIGRKGMVFSNFKTEKQRIVSKIILIMLHLNNKFINNITI